MAGSNGFAVSVGSDRPPAEVDHPVRRLEVSEILPGDTPRFELEDHQHARTLADLDTALPPITVHGRTGRVIDGMHRLRAAKMNGARYIDVRIFEGSVEEAFVESVRANVQHGKPLTRREREAAIVRILRAFPQWSDRAIAEVCGVSATTVGTIRRSPSAQIPQLDSRIGRDGRRRPVNSSDRRRYATEILSAHPELSLREVARRAGISPTTARDVRDQLADSAEPPPAPAELDVPQPAVRPSEEGPAELTSLLQDAALQSTEAGQRCVQLISRYLVSRRALLEISGELPRSRVYLVADLARHCANVWNEFADALQSRASGRR